MAESTASVANSTLDELARVARLPLPEQRKQAVGPVVDLVHGLVKAFDAVDFGDVPPATSFDARWE